jgi:hypothetical protein
MGRAVATLLITMQRLSINIAGVRKQIEVRSPLRTDLVQVRVMKDDTIMKERI